MFFTNFSFIFILFSFFFVFFFFTDKPQIDFRRFHFSFQFASAFRLMQFYVLVYIQELNIYLRNTTQRTIFVMTKFMLKVRLCLTELHIVWVWSDTYTYTCIYALCIGSHMCVNIYFVLSVKIVKQFVCFVWRTFCGPTLGSNLRLH